MTRTRIRCTIAGILLLAIIGLFFFGCKISVGQNDDTPQQKYFSVTSVTGNGMRIVNVAFDNSVDRDTAETTANYTVKNNQTTTVSVQTAKLLSDGKTVQLFLNAGMCNDAISDSIEIQNVQNQDKTALVNQEKYLFKATDSAVPAIFSVEALGSKNIRITFTEAMQGTALAAFKLDDKVLKSATGTDSSTDLYAVSVTYPETNNYLKALITFGNGLSVGSHTLMAGANNQLTDYNVSADGTAIPNSMTTATYAFSVASDNTVPLLLSVESLSRTKARYAFSKAINMPSCNAFFWSSSPSANSGTAAVSAVKITDTVLEVSWQSEIISSSAYFYAGSINYRIEDFSGNPISPLPSKKLVGIND